MKFKSIVIAFFLVFILVACDKTETQTTTETTTEATETTQKKEVIQVSTEAIDYDIMSGISESINLSNGSSVTGLTDVEVTKNLITFNNTPLQNEIMTPLEKVNQLSLDIQVLFNEALSKTVFYEDNSIDLSLDNLTLDINSYELSDTSLIEKIEADITLTTNHELVKSNHLTDEVKINIVFNEQLFKISMQNNVSKDEVLNLKIDLIENKIEAGYNLDNEGVSFTIQNDEDGNQLIRIEKANSTESSEQNLYFYGDKRNGAIFSKLEKPQTTIIDYEVFNKRNGTIYKAMSFEGEEESYSYNGITLNNIKNWRNAIINESRFELGLNHDLTFVQENLTNSLVTDKTNYHFSTNGFNVKNSNIYGDTPYYLAGYFIESQNYIEQMYQLDFELNDCPTLEVNSVYNKIIDGFTEKMISLAVEDEVISISPELSFGPIFSRGHDENSNTDVVIWTLEPEVPEVLLFDENNELVSHSQYNNYVSFQNGLLFIYGENNHKPMIEIKSLNQNRELVDVKDYYWNDFHNDGAIVGITYDQENNTIKAQYQEESSICTNTMIINMENDEMDFEYTSVFKEYIDEASQLTVKIVKDENDHLLLMLFDKDGKLQDVSRGTNNEAQATNILDVKELDGKMMLLGQNNGSPYFVFPKITDGKWDYTDVYSYNYRGSGVMNDVTFDAENNTYLANYTMSDGYTNTININLNTGLAMIYDHISQNFVKDAITPTAIVIHETANRNVGADAYLHYRYWNNDYRGTSAHFGVDETSVFQYLDLDDKGWHVGTYKEELGISNSNSVGIEICVNIDGDYDVAVQNAVKLTVQLMIELNVPLDRVVTHQMASSWDKPCPSTMIQNGLAGRGYSFEDFKHDVEVLYNSLTAEQ
ncbi:N-acetylmuramoyl-L-alanine amidase [Mycoplasmatota bacterium]|nr:N-acetylmuramoyl-L-alanine amidase [Mycoplasmatota bacterium]